MKHKFEAEFRAFAGKTYFLLTVLVFPVACMISYLLSGMIWQLGVIIAPIICMLVLGFLDYFAFAGANSRHAHGMELFKSSTRGEILFKKALKQDLINKSVISFAASVISGTFAALNTEKLPDLLFVVFYCFGAYATGQLVLRLVLFLTRKKGLTMQTHALILYLVYFVGSVLFIPLIFVSETESAIIMGIYTAVAEILSVLSAILLFRSCVRAYSSAFYDI